MKKTARQYQGETTDYSVHGLPKAEPTPVKPAPARKATLKPDSPLLVDETLHELAVSLRPDQFFARTEMWRRGDVSGTQYEPRVSGTRNAKMLTLDGMDVEVETAEAEYRSHLEGVSVAMAAEDHHEALRLLKKVRDLEELWLKPIITPNKEMAKELGRIASDAQSCNTCGDTKEAWVRRMKKLGHKTPLWRLRTGDCSACYQDKRKARLEELEAAS